jgi:hypothetical protein
VKTFFLGEFCAKNTLKGHPLAYRPSSTRELHLDAHLDTRSNIVPPQLHLPVSEPHLVTPPLSLHSPTHYPIPTTSYLIQTSCSQGHLPPSNLLSPRTPMLSFLHDVCLRIIHKLKTFWLSLLPQHLSLHGLPPESSLLVVLPVGNLPKPRPRQHQPVTYQTMTLNPPSLSLLYRLSNLSRRLQLVAKELQRRLRWIQ